MRRRTVLLRTLVTAVAALALGGCGLLEETAPPTAEVGDCLNISDLEEQLGGADSGEVTQLPTVDCGEEHDAEVLLAYDLPEGPLPEQSLLDGVVESQCMPQFQTYLGVPYEESQRFDMFTLHPTQDSWEGGDREVLCIIHTTDRSRVTGTFEGAERSGDDAAVTSRGDDAAVTSGRR